MNQLYRNLIAFKACFVGFFICVILTVPGYAEEKYTPGLYMDDSTGEHYIVSGALGQSGRTVWTFTSTFKTPTRYLSGIWETGHAIGNSILAGHSDIITNPDAYTPGSSYGVTGFSNLSGWAKGSFLVAEGDYHSVTITSRSTYSQAQLNLTLLEEGITMLASSEHFIPGVYRDLDGYGYLVSSAPSQNNNTVWTIVTSQDNPIYGCGIWETGSIVDNMLVTHNFTSVNPNGYALGRSYGLFGLMGRLTNSSQYTHYDWTETYSHGYQSAAVLQAGNTIAISAIDAHGLGYPVILIKDKTPSGQQGYEGESFGGGIYRSHSGKRYKITGSNAREGRWIWTMVPYNMPIPMFPTGMLATDYLWETGTAVDNSILAGTISTGGDIGNYPQYFKSGRAYGEISAIYGLSALQTGNSIAFGSDLFNSRIMILTRESSEETAIGPGTELFVAGTDYEDIYGNSYIVSHVGDIWSVTGTNGTVFNATWQTGPADENSLLVNKEYIAEYPLGYLPGKAYGVVGEEDLPIPFNLFQEGALLAAIQSGNSISLSQIDGAGVSYESLVITKGGTGGIGGGGKIAFATDLFYVNKLNTNAQAIIRVHRVDGGTGMVAVMYSSSDGSGVAGQEYTPVTGGMLSWASGDVEPKMITIDIPATASPGKNFFLTLYDPVGGATLGTQATTTVQIFDDIQQITIPLGDGNGGGVSKKNSLPAIYLLLLLDEEDEQ